MISTQRRHDDHARNGLVRHVPWGGLGADGPVSPKELTLTARVSFLRTALHGRALDQCSARAHTSHAADILLFLVALVASTTTAVTMEP